MPLGTALNGAPLLAPEPEVAWMCGNGYLTSIVRQCVLAHHCLPTARETTPIASQGYSVWARDVFVPLFSSRVIATRCAHARPALGPGSVRSCTLAGHALSAQRNGRLGALARVQRRHVSPRPLNDA
jgi:hypothetical protein